MDTLTQLVRVQQRIISMKIKQNNIRQQKRKKNTVSKFLKLWDMFNMKGNKNEGTFTDRKQLEMNIFVKK